MSCRLSSFYLYPALCLSLSLSLSPSTFVFPVSVAFSPLSVIVRLRVYFYMPTSVSIAMRLYFHLYLCRCASLPLSCMPVRDSVFGAAYRHQPSNVAQDSGFPKIRDPSGCPYSKGHNMHWGHSLILETPNFEHLVGRRSGLEVLCTPPRRILPSRLKSFHLMIYTTGTCSISKTWVAAKDFNMNYHSDPSMGI